MRVRAYMRVCWMQGVYKKCYFDILIHKRRQSVAISEFLIETGCCVFREKWYMAREKRDTLKNSKNRCGIVWVETVKIRWLAMKLKVAHMDAGGRKWCAQRQQSRIMQMLGNKLPVKHKKRSDFTITSNVWVRRFELPASWTPFKHATKLRYTQSCSEGLDSRRRGQPCEQN